MFVANKQLPSSAITWAQNESGLVGGRAIAYRPQAQRRQRIVGLSGRGAPSSDDPLRNLDLKNLNDLPLAKLSETANAVWERISRSTGINVKIAPSLNTPFLTTRQAATASPTCNGTVQSTDVVSPAPTTNGSAPRFGVSASPKEQQLMAALAQAQEEKRHLSQRTDQLRSELAALEAKNAALAARVEDAESDRVNVLALRDMERKTLTAQLAAAQQELQRAAEDSDRRESALDALRASQLQLQEELRDAVARLQAVDRSTEELRAQLSSVESSRAAAACERDELGEQLREVVARVDSLSSLWGGGTGGEQTDGLPPAGDSAPIDRTPGNVGPPPVVAAAAAQLQQLRSTTESAFAALRAAREELGVMRGENQQLAQRAEALTASNTQLAAAAETLRQQLGAARGEVDAARQEAEAARGAAAAASEAAVAAEGQRRVAESALAGMQAEAASLSEALAQLSAIRDAAAASGLGLVELAGMATQIAALKDQLAASRVSETDLKRRLAAAEVALLDSRRDAAAREARLTAEVAAARADAADLRSVLHARTLAVQAARRAGVPLAVAEGQFAAMNRFWVPADLMFDFVKAVAAREVALVEARGFLGLAVRWESHNTVAVSTHWESAAAFEDWSRGPVARRQHYPAGVYQYAPRRGEGVPEDYLPFKEAQGPGAAA